MARLHTIDCHSKASFLSTGTAVRRGVAELVDSENKGLIRKNHEKQRFTSIVGLVDWLTFIRRHGVSEASTEIAPLAQLLEMAAFCSVFEGNHTLRLTKGCRLE